MKIEIKHRWTQKVIVKGNYESIKDCLEKNRGAYLRGADLRGADLRGADLRGAYLRGADLSGADLSGIKGYSDSHDIAAEIIRRQDIEVFTKAEWEVIGQISIHRFCCAEIKRRFNKVVPHIFQILAEAGFDEYLRFWEAQ